MFKMTARRSVTGGLFLALLLLLLAVAVAENEGDTVRLHTRWHHGSPCVRVRVSQALLPVWLHVDFATDETHIASRAYYSVAGYSRSPSGLDLLRMDGHDALVPVRLGHGAHFSENDGCADGALGLGPGSPLRLDFASVRVTRRFIELGGPLSLGQAEGAMPCRASRAGLCLLGAAASASQVALSVGGDDGACCESLVILAPLPGMALPSRVHSALFGPLGIVGTPVEAYPEVRLRIGPLRLRVPPQAYLRRISTANQITVLRQRAISIGQTSRALLGTSLLSAVDVQYDWTTETIRLGTSEASEPVSAAELVLIGLTVASFIGHFSLIHVSPVASATGVRRLEATLHGLTATLAIIGMILAVANSNTFKSGMTGQVILAAFCFCIAVAAVVSTGWITEAREKRCPLGKQLEALVRKAAVTQGALLGLLAWTVVRGLGELHPWIRLGVSTLAASCATADALVAVVVLPGMFCPRPARAAKRTPWPTWLLRGALAANLAMIAAIMGMIAAEHLHWGYGAGLAVGAVGAGVRAAGRTASRLVAG